MLKRLPSFIIRFSTQKNKDNHFGFKAVPTQQKQALVDSVFHSVANKYDLMNDLMSIGIHRSWKNYFINKLGNLKPSNYYGKQNKLRILDVAGGTGDIAFKILQNHNYQNLQLTVLDINQSMLDQGKKKAQSLGLNHEKFVNANAEQLPFESNIFDAYTISFGLRNVPRTLKALKQAERVLKYGGKFMCLQFSKVQNIIFKQIYKQYSFNIIPKIGQIVSGDKDSYQYLVESIEKFLTQEQLKLKMQQAGFQYCNYQNLTNGIVAIHSGFKLRK